MQSAGAELVRSFNIVENSISFSRFFLVSHSFVSKFEFYVPEKPRIRQDLKREHFWGVLPLKTYSSFIFPESFIEISFDNVILSVSSAYY